MPATTSKSQISKTETIVLSIFIVLVVTGGVGYIVSLSIVACIIAPILLLAITTVVFWGRRDQSAPGFFQKFSQLVFKRKSISAMVGISLVLGIGVGIKAYNENQFKAEQSQNARIETEKQAIITAKENAEQQKRLAAETANRQKELLSNAPKTAETLTGTLTALQEKISKGDCLITSEEFEQVTKELAPYMELKAVPVEITAVKQTLQETKATNARCSSIYRAVESYKELSTLSADAEKRTRKNPAILAYQNVIDLCTDTLTALNTIESADKEFAFMIPKSLNTKKAIKSITKRQDWAQAEYNKIAAKEQSAQLKQKALEARCGRKPICGGFDGECVGLEAFVKKNAHDPSSIDVENCTVPQLTEEYCWVTKCDVRGKNTLGALVLNQMTFSMSTSGTKRIK